MKSVLLMIVAVFLSIDNGTSEPHFTAEPEDYLGFMGNFRSLSSTLDGAENPKYQWFHNDSALSGDGIFGADAAMVLIFAQTLESQGTYQLFVSSKMGKIFGREIKVEFILVGKFLSKDTQTLNVVIGQQFQIECPAHGLNQHAGYKWGGSDDVTGTWFFIDRPNVLVLSDGTLFFSHITQGDVDYIAQKGGISCLLEAADKNKDIRFEQSAVFELNVTGAEKKSFGPTMENIPDQEVVEGGTVSLRCIAAGYPTPTYRWEKMDKLGVTTKVFDDGSVLLRENNRQLTIKNIMKDRHAGTYTCHATIDDGGVKKTAQESSTVVVREKPEWVQGTLIKSAKPNIYTQHSWKCMAKGDPEPEYSWYANTTIMNNVSGRHTIEGGILTFHRVTPEDDGMYQCVAKNEFGFAYQTVSMEVQVKAPEISHNISEENFVANGTGVISCVSDALPQASHHWLFNGVKLEPNKTAKYTLTSRQDLMVHNLTQNDAGAYECVATNIYGQATKSKLIKVAEVMFTQQPQNNTNVTEDTDFSLICEANSDPPLKINYRWLFEGADLTNVNHKWDANTHTLTVFKAQAEQSGVYECIAYSGSSRKSSTATVIVRALPRPPQDLTLQGTCSSSTANLTWVIPYRSVYEPLTRIMIQWSTSRDTSTWYDFPDHVAGSANGYVITKLNPYSDIIFRVIAVNGHGMGKPSNSTAGQKCETPAKVPTVCPITGKENSTHPHDINVTWQDVEPIYHNGPGFGYIVHYRKRGSNTWHTKSVSNGNKTRITIYNTSASELWEFKVGSYNDLGTTQSDCPIVIVRSGKEAEIMFNVRPENRTDVQKGSSFSLNCEAYSNPSLPIKYKWLHKGKETGQTGKTYTVSASELQDSGIYECVAYVKTSIYNVDSRSASTVIVGGPPNPPRDLSLSGTCLNFSANLTWTEDRDSYNPVTNLTIQWSAPPDTSTWFDVTDHVADSANGHLVRGLQPYSDIVFRVIAENKYGKSVPSDSTSGQECKTAEAKPTICPEDVQGSVEVPNSIFITWKAVPKLYQNGLDFAYNVSFRKPGSQWQHEVVEEKESYTISNAGVDQLWEFRVQSKNSQGNGPECQTKEAQTARQSPNLAPKQLRSKNVGPDYVILEWQPVVGAGVEGYQLSYWYKGPKQTRVRRTKITCDDDNSPCTTRIQNYTTREHKQANLKPYKKYTMFLQAYNLAGLGPSSNRLTLTTEQGRPGKPEHVNDMPYGRYINLTWQPPGEANGVITGYVVGITNGSNITLDGSARMYIFENLKPRKDYVVSITAKTSAGPGTIVSKIVTTTEMRVPAVANPPNVYSLDKDSVNVTYNPSSQSGGFPEKFYILYKEKDQDNKDLKATNATWIRNESHIVIDGLKNDKHYLFATVVMNGDLKSAMSDFTAGHPLLIEEVSDRMPIYRQFWFYIILAIILLLLLLLLLLLFIRRKPKRTYRVGEREKKRAVDGEIEMGEDKPLKDAEINEGEPQGKTYDPIIPTKNEAPELASSPPTSNGRTQGGDRDSLDEYEGSDDDFSEHGSFIGQYGNGEKAGASESSLPSYV